MRRSAAGLGRTPGPVWGRDPRRSRRRSWPRGCPPHRRDRSCGEVAERQFGQWRGATTHPRSGHRSCSSRARLRCLSSIRAGSTFTASTVASVERRSARSAMVPVPQARSSSRPDGVQPLKHVEHERQPILVVGDVAGLLGAPAGRPLLPPHGANAFDHQIPESADVLLPNISNSAPPRQLSDDRWDQTGLGRPGASVLPLAGQAFGWARRVLLSSIVQLLSSIEDSSADGSAGVGIGRKERLRPMALVR